MLHRLDPVFFLFTGLVLFLSRVVVLVFRRRWSLAEARREEVMRLVHLALEEATRAEMESVLAGGSGCSAGTSDARPREAGGGRRCAVCYSPTTTRCSRCKSVRYCSGKCQIVHWRQGHREECCPSHVGHGNGQLRVSDLNRLQTERSELSRNGLEIEGKPFARPVEALFERTASSESNCCSEVFSEEDNFQDKPFVSTSGTESSSESSTSYAFSGPIETLEDVSSSEITTMTVPEQSASAFFSGTSVKSGESLYGDGSGFPRTGGEVSTCKSEEVEVPLGVSLSGSENCTISHLSNECYDKIVGIRACHSAKVDNVSDKTFQGGDYPHVGVGPPFQMSRKLSGQVKPSISISRIEVSSCEMAPLKEATLLESTDTTVVGSEKSSRVSSGRNNHAQTFKLKESTCLSSAAHVDHRLLSGGGCSVLYGTSSKVDNSLNAPTRPLQSKTNVLNGNKDWKISVRKVIDHIKAPKTSRQYPSRVCSLIPEKHSYKMVFPYEIFIKLYNLNVELCPFGLINCGNSCYANVVLQCLTFTRPLTAYFLDGFHTKTCPKKDWCFACELECLLVNAKQGNSPLSPIRIISHIKKIGRNLDRGREEDAHEFLRYAIDAMQSACLKEAGANVVGRMNEPTLLELIFGGYLQSKIRCMRCQVKSEQHERMMDLNVEIHDVRTLGEALTRFTTTEILDGKNKYYCNGCKSYERAKKKLTILEAPNVLTITLKRYQSGKFGKLNKAIHFPECMNLAPYMNGTEDKSPVYRLYGVVVHLDTMNAAFSGHYVCYVKSSQGTWYEIDDSMVKPVDLDTVLTKGAYMLFYSRSSPRAPSLVGKVVSKDLRDIKKGVPSRHEESQTSRMCSTATNAHTNFGLDGTFDERFRNLSMNSSSDNSSLLSCSDEGSWSTESTRNSFSAGDYSEYLFGESDRISRSSGLIF